jgi:vacuolar iron transporter family protein
MDNQVYRLCAKAQKNEITEHHTYSRLAGLVKNKENKKILLHLAKDEHTHYDFWKKQTNVDVAPSMLKVHWYVFIARILGLSFGLRLMERGEHFAQEYYQRISNHVPGAAQFILEEHEHETKLIAMIEEERLEYAGSIVLGLNDALVELTGALAGLTFALQDGKVISIIGLITGIAASMSMAASEFLSSREENSSRNPVKAAVYTGVAYIITVLILVSPYFYFENVFHALLVMLVLSIVIILSYTFYITTAKKLPFKRRFLEMAAISLSVAAISFVIGGILKNAFGV